MKKEEENQSATLRDLETWGGNLAFQIDGVSKELEEFKQKTTKRFDKVDTDMQDIKKGLAMNTEALVMLTKELREVKRVEFQVENHEARITKLEAR